MQGIVNRVARSKMPTTIYYILYIQHVPARATVSLRPSAAQKIDVAYVCHVCLDAVEVHAQDF